ncbi:MAG TPA: hypothetical protein VNF74_04395 [Terriglobales bacterium]|nr:hypothetical protein [Terriglobales bacterium]
MTRPPTALALPPPLPALGGETVKASMAHGWQALRERWLCLGPNCGERNGLRSWCKLPARIQLQQGWCCSPECFQAAFEQMAAPLLRTLSQPRAPRPHRVPLGLLLLSRGRIDSVQLRQALQAQQAENHGRIGDWLIRQGAIAEDDIAAAVGLQWARPLYPLAQSQTWRLCRGWVPLALLQALRMLPLHFAADRRRLYVGFTQTVEFTALAALAQIFECKIESCIVTDSSLDAALEELRTLPGSELVQDIAFDRMDNAAEIAGVVRQYARYAEARQIRLAAAGPFLWVRIRGERVVHLTFRGR